MSEILDYILANYVWILTVAITVLLAIIGYYADKTNFGQGKKTPKEEPKKEEVQPIEEDLTMPLESALESSIVEEPIVEQEPAIETQPTEEVDLTTEEETPIIEEPF